jgi:hypothetical protein
VSRDGPVLGAVKAVVRAFWELEYGVRRWLRRARGKERYRLGGACEGCAKCCEAPSVAVGFFTWYFPTIRSLFLSWQRVVNGFELVRAEREDRVFVFACSHFDRKTRRCDSYETRPFMCRDYPRLLLEQPWPELFDGCGYRAIDTEGGRLSGAIDAADLPEEKKKELKRRLHVLDRE